MNCFVVTGWKISQPQRSQEKAWILMAGLTSDTRVVMPLTVMRCPRCSPLTLRTAKAFVLPWLLDPEGVKGLKLRLYRRVNSAGKVEIGRVVSISASIACDMV